MAKTDSPIFFAVVERETLNLVYCGDSDSMAARKWRNGTVHGQGETEAEAISDARQNAIRVQQGLEAAVARLRAILASNRDLGEALIRKVVRLAPTCYLTILRSERL